MSKRPYKKKALPFPSGETAPKERQQHQGGLKTEISDRDASGKAVIKRQSAVAECVLDAYFIRELISDPQYQAGMKFRYAYLRAMLRIKVADRGAGSHHDPEMSVITLIHSERLVKEAYAALDITEQTVVIAVCGHDEWAGGNHRMPYLQSGLDRLAILWKIYQNSL